MKTWETICNIEKNNKLHIIFSRKMILRSSMMPLLSSLFLSRGRLQALPPILACVHGPTYPLVFAPSPLPLCFFVRYTSSFVMHPGSGLCFFSFSVPASPDQGHDRPCRRGVGRVFLAGARPDSPSRGRISSCYRPGPGRGVVVELGQRGAH